VSDSSEHTWDIVADCETAGVVDEQIRKAGLEEELTVRTHPWLPAGQIIALDPEYDYWPGGLQ
jgi:hypothetical protein